MLNTFNQMVIKETKALEAFKLELSALVKFCAAVTTVPPTLLEHIARERIAYGENWRSGCIINVNCTNNGMSHRK